MRSDIDEHVASRHHSPATRVARSIMSARRRRARILQSLRPERLDGSIDRLGRSIVESADDAHRRRICIVALSPLPRPALLRTDVHAEQRR